MRHDVTGRPALLKRMNLSLVYQALMDLGTATRPEIAAHTALSATTIRGLLEELLEAGEVTALDLDASSGGRRARRYALDPRRSPFLCLFWEAGILVWRAAGLTGETLAEGTAETGAEDPLPVMLQVLEDARRMWGVRAVGLGVPGIVEEGRYRAGEAVSDIGERLQQRLTIPVILENDLNCIALGFARRYAGEAGGMDNVHLAYIHFNRACSGAGIIAGGRVVRGAKQFAGELGYLPLGRGGTLDDVLAAGGAAETADAAARAVACVCCVTSPALVVLGGERIAAGEIDLSRVRSGIDGYLPAMHRPALTACTDYRDDYLSGLACLTGRTLLPMLPLEEKA